MRTTLVRYRTLPDQAEDNQRAIEAVFGELAQRGPRGLRYAAMRAPDATFYHLVMAEPGAGQLSELEAFRAFREGLRQRASEAPASVDVTLIGHHRIATP